ncbi:MAG: CsgG/HfaB family protein [Spirochaetaceae bacterium]|nr:CsgG/HfaB family protein [Spirochaetaceae bacterium]
MAKKRVFMLMTLAFLSTVFAAGAFAEVEIIIQRADSKINAGFKERIFVDGSNKLSLANGESGTIRVPDGDHTIYAELYTLKTAPLSFSARSGTVRFTVTPHSLRNFVIERTGGGQQQRAQPAITAPDVFNNFDDAFNDTSVEGALLRAGNTIMEKLTPRSRLAIVYVTAQDAEISEFIAGELEFIMVSRGFILIDRSELDRIRKEQSFQSSGEVDDSQAVSIGKIAGADVIITGAVTGTGNLRRLRLRALNTQTGQVLTTASERY